MIDYDILWEGMREILKKHSFRTGKFTLSSGKETDVYIDCRPVLLDGVGLDNAGFLMRKFCQDTVAGTGLGGTLLVASIILNGFRDGVYIRSEEKSHGTNNKVEYAYDCGNAITVVDDVLTTGKSIDMCIEALQKEKKYVSNVVVLLDRDEGGREYLSEKYCIPISYIFNKLDLCR